MSRRAMAGEARLRSRCEKAPQGKDSRPTVRQGYTAAKSDHGNSRTCHARRATTLWECSATSESARCIWDNATAARQLTRHAAHAKQRHSEKTRRTRQAQMRRKRGCQPCRPTPRQKPRVRRRTPPRTWPGRAKTQARKSAPSECNLCQGFQA